METDRANRPYDADPTANTAIGHVTSEERRRKDAERKKLLTEDFSAVINEARRLKRTKISFYDVPIENLELILAALRNYGH